MFQHERDLVDTLAAKLQQGLAQWGRLRIAREFEYMRGRTDLVGVAEDGSIIAFEAKLGRWREALRQAGRNLCFAHRSYVVLPAPVAERASRYPAEFEKRNVGICSVESGSITVMLEAPENTPVQPWLSKLAGEWIHGGPLERAVS